MYFGAGLWRSYLKFVASEFRFVLTYYCIRLQSIRYCPSPKTKKPVEFTPTGHSWQFSIIQSSKQEPRFLHTIDTNPTWERFNQNLKADFDHRVGYKMNISKISHILLWKSRPMRSNVKKTRISFQQKTSKRTFFHSRSAIDFESIVGKYRINVFRDRENYMSGVLDFESLISSWSLWFRNAEKYFKVHKLSRDIFERMKRGNQLFTSGNKC